MASTKVGNIRGPTGPAGSPYTTTINPFTVPAVGDTTTADVEDASWILVGEMVYVDEAGGPGQAGVLQVTEKAGNTLTLFNPPSPSGGATTYPPLANTVVDGLLRKVSGNIEDYVAGDNNCYPLSTYMPTGAVIDFAGATAPNGWALCDGGAVSRTGATANLYAVIGTTFGVGDGSTTFNLPDLRSRVSVGAGQGGSLSDRALAQKGGEESHRLTTSELATHTHIQNAHTHVQNSHNHVQNQHAHSTQAWWYGVAAAGSNPVVAATNWQPGAIPWTTDNVTPTNQPTTATNQNTTATNQSAGGDGAHNTMPPFIVMNKIIKL